MAKQHRIVKSEDATTIIVEGDRSNPEPAHVIDVIQIEIGEADAAAIKFPGGEVRVVKMKNGAHSAEICVHQSEEEDPGKVVDAKIMTGTDEYDGVSYMKHAKERSVCFIGIAIRSAK